MAYGICNLGIVPLRGEKSNQSEMVSQVLYGETFKILEERKDWSKIRLAHDRYEGWMNNNQFLQISKKEYQTLENKKPRLTIDLVDYVVKKDKSLLAVPLGSVMNGAQFLGHQFDGNIRSGTKKKAALIETALFYLNAPYLWGGKTPFGIDCSGLVQMVFKLNGHQLPRDSPEQAKTGETLGFLEESEPGDIAFFDNKEGRITHVGIILENNRILHAHGKVRIDRLDQTGIYNAEKRKYSHRLRVIKKIV